jgi:hypothetical protein
LSLGDIRVTDATMTYQFNSRERPHASLCPNNDPQLGQSLMVDDDQVHRLGTSYSQKEGGRTDLAAVTALYYRYGDARVLIRDCGSRRHCRGTAGAEHQTRGNRA